MKSGKVKTSANISDNSEWNNSTQKHFEVFMITSFKNMGNRAVSLDATLITGGTLSYLNKMYSHGVTESSVTES